MQKTQLPLACGLLATAMLLATSCSHLGATESHKFVKYSGSVPPLAVPPGISNPEGESYYPVPPVSYSAPPGTVPPLAPPGSQLARQVNNAKLPPPG